MGRMVCLVMVSVGCLSACKDPDRAAAEQKQQSAQEKLTEGRQFMSQGMPGQAVKAFKAASAMSPTDPVPVLLLADALREAGNDGAAILALKQAADLSEGADMDVKRQLIELYKRAGHSKEAIRALDRMRKNGELSDAEVLGLARLQAQLGLTDDAFKTLETIQSAKPDDPAAKTVEAEILLATGDELSAARVMDRLVKDHPTMPEVRTLRARYFVNSGFAEDAEKELAEIQSPAAEHADVVLLKARVFNALRRYEDAESALKAHLARTPKDVDAMAALAETELLLQKPEDAQTLVNDVLALRPRSPTALYLGGRALEAQGELKRAADSYEQSLHTDPSFAPALSRVWRIYAHRGEKMEAMTTLEKLFFMREASLDEKVSLAEMYADNGINVERAKKIVAEALKAESGNARYKELKDRLAKVKSLRGSGGNAKSGPIIMRGGR